MTPDPTTTRVVLSVTATPPSGQAETKMQEFDTAPFDVLGVAFPPGTTGPTTFAVSLYNSPTCLVGSGTAMLTINSDGDFDLVIQITPPPLTCGAPSAMLTVQVVNSAMGAGTVTSQPAGINCSSSGMGCTTVLSQGTQITLHAQATMGNFLGWSGMGVSCPGVNDCALTLSADTVVQALFSSCNGWCQEPSGTTQNLYGVFGLAPNNVVVVGDNGTILGWNGTSWAAQSSGTTKTLRAVTVPTGSKNYTVAGLGGTVLGNTGQGWSPATASSTMDFYGTGGTSDTAIYVVGTGGTALKGSLSGGFTSLSTLPSGIAGKQLNAVTAQVNNGSSSEFLIVGNGGYTLRWTSFGTWDETPTGSANFYGAWYGNHRIVAVGDTSTIVSRTYNGVYWPGWQTETSPVANTSFRAVWGAAETDMYIVGDSGTILHWDGSSWSTSTSHTTVNLHAVWGTDGNNIYAVGDMGTILHYVQ